MIIPYNSLAPETLANLIEHYVLREGTDYGEIEVSIKDKVTQVRSQLQTGEALIIYSELHDSINIIKATDFQSNQYLSSEGDPS